MRTWSKERRLVAVCPVINRVRVSTRSLSTRVRLPFPVLTSMKTLLTQAASTCGGGRSGLEASREVECDELRAVGDDPMRPGDRVADQFEVRRVADAPIEARGDDAFVRFLFHAT